MERRLVSRYRGRWVAVVRGKVVDHGADEDALFARVARRMAGATVFLARVGVAPMVVDMPGFVIE
jgi:hypothetical protein